VRTDAAVAAEGSGFEVMRLPFIDRPVGRS
jgi:hypothetical protein